MDYTQGHGEAFMEALYQELPPAIQERTRNRVKFSPPSERLTLMADTAAAVTILEAAINNPEVVGNVACFSPKLFLPLNRASSAEKHILKTIKTQGRQAEDDFGTQMLYSTQKYYLDQGENDDFFFPMAQSFDTSTTVVSALKSSLHLKDNVNLLFHVVPKENLNYLTDSPPDVLSRLKYPLQFFFKAQGGVREDYARSLTLDEAFFVDQRNRITLVSGTGGSSNNATNNSGTAAKDDILHGFSQATDDCIPQPCNMVEVPLIVYLGSIGNKMSCLQLEVMTSKSTTCIYSPIKPW